MNLNEHWKKQTITKRKKQYWVVDNIKSFQHFRSTSRLEQNIKESTEKLKEMEIQSQCNGQQEDDYEEQEKKLRQTFPFYLSTLVGESWFAGFN